MTEHPAPFLSTAEAARLLGLSTTLVQSLVDKQELKGWKTRGGHRRISLQSIHDYQARSGGQPLASSRLSHPPKIVIVIESDGHLQVLQHACAQWQFPLQLQFADSVTAALLDLAIDRPDMLLVEMTMPLAQQEKTLLALDSFNARSRPLSIVLVTREKQLHTVSLAESSSRIQVVNGPLSELWLHAYLTGVTASFRPPGEHHGRSQGR
ncbi:MAG: helix-turn-helix domain-containing protein [Betaproteobacteria bacterium]|nr:helix-turn-helix domain-containing protein [Betaproteobacteria bacterium]